MPGYKEAGALRVGDVWIDLGNGAGNPWMLRVVEVGEHTIRSIVTVIGEDVIRGTRHAFEFYRPAFVRLADGEAG